MLRQTLLRSGNLGVNIGTVEPGNSKLFEKQQMVYYCQEFTIEEVIDVINGLKSCQKKFTIARLFTIDRFTIARFDCT